MKKIFNIMLAIILVLLVLPCRVNADETIVFTILCPDSEFYEGEVKYKYYPSGDISSAIYVDNGSSSAVGELTVDRTGLTGDYTFVFYFPGIYKNATVTVNNIEDGVSSPSVDLQNFNETENTPSLIINRLETDGGLISWYEDNPNYYQNIEGMNISYDDTSNIYILELVDDVTLNFEYNLENNHKGISVENANLKITGPDKTLTFNSKYIDTFSSYNVHIGNGDLTIGDEPLSEDSPKTKIVMNDISPIPTGNGQLQSIVGFEINEENNVSIINSEIDYCGNGSLFNAEFCNFLIEKNSNINYRFNSYQYNDSSTCVYVIKGKHIIIDESTINQEVITEGAAGFGIPEELSQGIYLLSGTTCKITNSSIEGSSIPKNDFTNDGAAIMIKTPSSYESDLYDFDDGNKYSLVIIDSNIDLFNYLFGISCGGEPITANFSGDVLLKNSKVSIYSKVQGLSSQGNVLIVDNDENCENYYRFATSLDYEFDFAANKNKFPTLFVGCPYINGIPMDGDPQTKTFTIDAPNLNKKCSTGSTINGRNIESSGTVSDLNDSYSICMTVSQQTPPLTGFDVELDGDTELCNYKWIYIGGRKRTPQRHNHEDSSSIQTYQFLQTGID